MVQVSTSIPELIIYLNSLRWAFCAVIDGWASFNTNCLFELDIWEEIVKRSMRGVPFHKLLWKMPTTIFFMDASGIRMGSYHFNSGLTWNYIFPSNILEHITIN